MEPLAEAADRTLAAYERHARRAITSWASWRRPSHFLQAFARRLPRGARILDYGCGIGTDLTWLHCRGFRVEGLDGTPAFVREARRRNPDVPVTLQRFAAWAPSGVYDGIWANASLFHLPPGLLATELSKLRQALRLAGILGLSLAWGRRKNYLVNDWIPDRYCAGFTKPEVVRLLRGWTIDDLRVVAHDGREGRWIHVLASPAGNGHAGPA